MSQIDTLINLNEDEKKVLVELAFIAKALKITSTNKLNLLKEMVKEKPTNEFNYQKLN